MTARLINVGAPVKGAVIILILLVIMWMIGRISLYPVHAQRDWDKIVFLRAFKSDDLTRRDRELIQASLPPRTKLAGIRDPRRRCSLWTRFLV
jgi:hypothetical protein